MRICRECLISKELTRYAADKNCKGGRKTQCRECINKKRRMLYTKHIWPTRYNKMGEKKCNTCNEYLNVTMYTKQKSSKDGLSSRCTTCNSEKQKKYRESNKERYLNYGRIYRENNKDKVKTRNKSKYKRNKTKYMENQKLKYNKTESSARAAVYQAVKKGVLIKPDKCSKCGRLENIQAHHEDYNKKLDVIWLCAMCHKRIHGAGLHLYV